MSFALRNSHTLTHIHARIFKSNSNKYYYNSYAIIYYSFNILKIECKTIAKILEIDMGPLHELRIDSLTVLARRHCKKQIINDTCKAT